MAKPTSQAISSSASAARRNGFPGAAAARVRLWSTQYTVESMTFGQAWRHQLATAAGVRHPRCEGSPLGAIG